MPLPFNPGAWTMLYPSWRGPIETYGMFLVSKSQESCNTEGTWHWVVSSFSETIRRTSHSGCPSLPWWPSSQGNTCQRFCPSWRPSCDQRTQFHSCSASNCTCVSELYCYITCICLPSALIKNGLIFQHFGSSLLQHPHQEMLWSAAQAPLWHVPSNTGEIPHSPPWDMACRGAARDQGLWLMSLCTTELPDESINSPL